MKPLFFDTLDDAQCWLDERRKYFHPYTSLRIYSLAGRINHLTASIKRSGYVLSTKACFEYVGRFELAYANTHYGRLIINASPGVDIIKTYNESK